METQLCCLMGKWTKLSIKDELELYTQDLTEYTHQTLEKHYQNISLFFLIWEADYLGE